MLWWKGKCRATSLCGGKGSVGACVCVSVWLDVLRNTQTVCFAVEMVLFTWMSAVSKQNSFLCGPLCMRVCLHGSECSIVHVSGWVWVCLQMRDAESPGSGVINSSWPLGSVKLGGRLSLFLILFLPGPLAGGPLTALVDWLREWQR